MTDFGRFPGFRISDAPPMYSPVWMYIEIQVFAGFPELKIATFANTFRCFWTSGNPGFEQFRGARNRDFREEVPPLCGIGEPRFSRLPRSSSRISMARDLGDAAGQTYPRIVWPVIEAPVRPIGAFRAGMAGSAEPEIGASRAKFRRFEAPEHPIFRDFRDQVPAF